MGATSTLRASVTEHVSGVRGDEDSCRLLPMLSPACRAVQSMPLGPSKHPRILGLQG